MSENVITDNEDNRKPDGTNNGFANIAEKNAKSMSAFLKTYHRSSFLHRM